MMTPANPALQRMMMDVPVQVDVVLGDVRMPVADLMALSAGDVVALDRALTDTVDLYVANTLTARGRLVLADGELGVTITEILDIRD
ncbi:MAG: FliM/FliN family flagellar motor switch protein [Pseudomonadota bacterium]